MRTAAALACASLFAAAGAAPSAPVDYNRQIQPLLASRCYACHGPDEKARKGDLRLDVRAEALEAKAIVPGKPDESELLRRVTSKDADEAMPPPRSKKPALTAAEAELFRRWIAEGAKYSEHWSFARLTRPAVPAVKDRAWVRNPVDAFILARIEAAGLTPNKEADRVTLIRRLSFDLTGLPPTPEEVRAFVKDARPDAYEKLVDRLLESPHYGERMAVFWLDLVRYADSIGYHSDNPMNVSPFRDYVIRSFNANLPFDRFTTEQMAGDLLPNPTLWQKVATAYNRLLQTTEEGGAQAREYEAKNAADRVRNFGQVWLGGTIMCAECHNHKFDPYTSKDFYSLEAFFADVQEAAIGRREPGMPVATPEQEKALAKADADLAAARAKLQAAAAEYLKRPDALTKLPPNAKVPPALKKLIELPPEKRVVKLDAPTTDFLARSVPELKPQGDAVAAAQKHRAAVDATIRRVLVTTSGPPRVVRILPRGNWLDTTGPVVSPATPAFLPPLPPLANPKGRYTRLDLARWTVSRDNPLTARVFVNRTWKLFFGRGISASLEESGSQGKLPTHPELLDWLACEFQDGWDVKKLVRLLVTSNAYRQSSVETPARHARDPSNQLFARQARYRLDAEFVRDNALAVSGLLVPVVGGPSVKPYQPPGYWAALNFPTREWQKDAGDKVYRRGLYTHWQRTFLHPAMLAFDAPSREECTCERPRSNIPQQALVLLNDPEFVEAARAFAALTLARGGADDAARVGWAFARATGRRPGAEEAQVLLALLAKHRKEYAADPKAAAAFLKIGDAPLPRGMAPTDLAAWANVCRVILNLHETITRS